MKCIYCDTSLPERAFYCSSCSNQIKCKNCNEILEPNAQACVMCGVKVGDGEVKSKVSNNITQTMNTFEFSETHDERKAIAILTDESVKSLSETLTGVVTANSLLNFAKGNGRLQLSGEQNITDIETDIELVTDAKTIEIKAKSVSTNESEIAEKLKSIFYQDEDKLVLEIQDLKATGPKDFGIRLVYLRLLYSKEVQKEEFTLRENLNDTLKEVMGVLDPNVVNWVSKNNDLALKQEGEKTYIRLKGDGYTKALNVLEEIHNKELKEGHIPEKKSRSSFKSSSKAEDASTKTTSSNNKGRIKSKIVDEWINKWNSLKLGIDLHGIAKDLPQIDRVLLAVWVIYKATNGNVDAATTYKIEPIIKDLFFCPGGRGNLAKALKNGYKDHLQKTTDGWRITPTGVKKAENLISYSDSASKTKTKK